MESFVERRAAEFPRVPVHLLVELSPDGEAAERYEADAVDLGRGGIGLRAAVLPEVGQRLRCRFELPDTGQTCEAAGEVVWTDDADRGSGAFGVRFDLVDDRTARALDALVPGRAEEMATEPGVPRTGRLRLAGVASPIEGELVEAGGCVAIEQALPMLAIGRGAEIEHAGGRTYGVIAGVRLRIDGGVPRLRLEIAAPHAAPYAATHAPAPSDATLQDEPLDQMIERSDALRAAPRAREAPEVVVARHPIDEEKLREASTLTLRLREIGKAVRPAMLRAWRAGCALATAAFQQIGPWLARARDGAVIAFRVIATRAPELAPVLRPARRRRTTAAPPSPGAATPARRRGQDERMPEPRGRGRLVLLGVAALAMVGLAAYGLGASGAEPSPREVHRDIETPPTPALVGPVTVPEAVAPIAPIAPIAPGGADTETPAPIEPRAHPESVAVAGPTPLPSDPSLAAQRSEPRAASTVPAAAAPAPVAAVAPATAVVTEFGASSVPGGRTTVLRMSAPIRGLEGVRDPHGFTVTVHGALSLDRAGPIAASHSAIERASILNRGDHCVLTVRFVEGRSRPYRVVARGASLEVTIGR
jgi:hypothetical protein